MLYINEVHMPNPSKYDVQFSDLDSSESARNEQGVLLRNRIRQGVAKISVSWKVRGDKIATIIGAIEPAELEVKYFDPRKNAYGEATMYSSDRNCQLVLYTEDMDFSQALWEISMNLIEY